MQVGLPSVQRSAPGGGKGNDLFEREAHILSVPLRNRSGDRQLHRETAIEGKRDLTTPWIVLLLPGKSNQRTRFVKEQPDRMRVEFRPRDALPPRTVQDIAKQFVPGQTSPKLVKVDVLE